MAFLIKSAKNRVAGPSSPGFAWLDQRELVSRAAKTVPQTTTEQLFRVYGGRVLVKALIGEVTTIMPATDAQLSVLSKKLDNAGAAVGTAVTIASTVTSANREVGGTFYVEGDGTALVAANAGNVLIGSNSGQWICPQGEIYLNAAASSTTGAIKWDLWYQPLDPGAYVVAVDVATAAI